MDESDEFNFGQKLVNGVKLSDLVTEAEFQIDVDFKDKQEINCDDDFLFDDDNSTADDVLKKLEDSTKSRMLESPDYHSFSELATKMVDCEPNGDVKILILSEGTGPPVPEISEVSIHYSAYWEREKVPFDTTLTKNKGRPMHVVLGAGAILPGLEVALRFVKGPRARMLLLLQPRAAWGPMGVLPRIRPEPALFHVALYDVIDVQAEVRFFQLPPEEQQKYEVTVETVDTLHVVAKDLFTKNKISDAIRRYERAFRVINQSKPITAPEVARVIDLKIKTCINLAVCFCKMDQPKKVIQICQNLDMISDINKHCKALFCLSKAWEKVGCTDKAIMYYRKALRLEPKNKDIGDALAKLDRSERKGEDDLKRIWQSAFKSASVETSKFKVDSEFVDSVKDMCQTLAESEEHAKFDLSQGLTKDEVDCIKTLCAGFKGLIVEENGFGKQKKLAIVKVPDLGGSRDG